MHALNAIAAAEKLFVLDDAAQGFGATIGNRNIGTLADATTTSFFPAKPLGCYGDGGAVFTDDAGMAEILASLRVHGQGSDKYDNVRIGLTARLDTIQAAVLIEKLEDLPRRDRSPQPRRPALCAGPGRRRHGAEGAARRHLGLGAIHHPHPSRHAATPSRRR